METPKFHFPENHKAIIFICPQTGLCGAVEVNIIH